MKWTERKPVKPGWYWRKKSRDDLFPVVSEVFMTPTIGSTGIYLACATRGIVSPMSMLEGLWHGPIPVPSDE